MILPIGTERARHSFGSTLSTSCSLKVMLHGMACLSVELPRAFSPAARCEYDADHLILRIRAQFVAAT